MVDRRFVRAERLLLFVQLETCRIALGAPQADAVASDSAGCGEDDSDKHWESRLPVCPLENMEGVLTVVRISLSNNKPLSGRTVSGNWNEATKQVRNPIGE